MGVLAPVSVHVGPSAQPPIAGWDKIFRFVGTQGTPQIFCLRYRDLPMLKFVLFFQLWISFNNKVHISFNRISFYRKSFLFTGNPFLSQRKVGCLANISLESKDFVGTRFPGSPGKSRPAPSALAEFYRRRFLHSHVQTSPPTTQKSYPKFQNSTTRFWLF